VRAEATKIRWDNPPTLANLDLALGVINQDHYRNQHHHHHHRNSERDGCQPRQAVMPANRSSNDAGQPHQPGDPAGDFSGVSLLTCLKRRFEFCPQALLPVG
jgi:hypothetical protein